MMRKRPRRATGDSENRGRVASAPRPQAEKPSAARPLLAAAAPPRRSLVHWAMNSLLAATALLLVWLVVAYVLQRWSAERGAWPTPAEIGLSTAAGLGGTAVLMAASLLATLAHRAARRSASLAARGWLLAALIMGGLFVVVRTYELRDLHANGLWQRGAYSSPHDHPGLYYVQAARQRLQQLYSHLEDLRTNHSDRFSEADAERLELITRLQSNMIGWTEHQVGHWLEDLSQRRGLMEVVAYQVHPLAREKAAVENVLQQESRDLARQRQWFAVLRDYCQQKSELHRQLRSASQAPVEQAPVEQAPVEQAPVEQGSAMAAANQSVMAAKPPTIELRYATLQEADLAVQQKLESLGLQDWSFARSVVADTADGPLTAERLNQIVAYLDAMDSRETFVDELVRPVLDNPETEGLNEKYRWLRLPVYFPHARSWTHSYLAMTLLHAVLLACTVLLSLLLLLWPGRGSPAARWRFVLWCWHGASMIAIALLLMFYIV